jgi:hypothetical protein
MLNKGRSGHTTCRVQCGTRARLFISFFHLLDLIRSQEPTTWAPRSAHSMIMFGHMKIRPSTFRSEPELFFEFLRARRRFKMRWNCFGLTKRELLRLLRSWRRMHILAQIVAYPQPSARRPARLLGSAPPPQQSHET